MAQKRMFSNLVIGSDDFLEMPDSSQNLYFHLSMNADDDGFVDNWKSIMRMIGKKEDDLKILIAKSFIIPFQSGVIVIKHWRLNNYIQKDRYKETIHQAEKSLLTLDNNNVYNMDTNCIQSVYTDKNRLDKISIDKISSSSSSNNNINNTKEIAKIEKLMVNCLRTTNTNNIMECTEYLDKLPIELIEYALKKTSRTDRPSWKYAMRILNDYSEKKYTTLDQVKADELSFKSRGQPVRESEEEKRERKIRELKEACGSG